MANEGDFKAYLIGFGLFTLFAVTILSAFISMGNAYDKQVDDVVEGMDFTSFNQTISDISGEGERLDDKFKRSSFFTGALGVLVVGGLDVAKDMMVLVITPYSLLSNILRSFGVPPYVTGFIFALLLFVVILSVWRLLKIGS